MVGRGRKSAVLRGRSRGGVVVSDAGRSERVGHALFLAEDTSVADQQRDDYDKVREAGLLRERPAPRLMSADMGSQRGGGAWPGRCDLGCILISQR